MYIIKGIVFCTLFVLSNALDKTVCEHLLDTLDCPTGLIIQVNSVLYGRTQNSICNYNAQPLQNVHCQSTSVSTQAVIRNCQGRNTCIIQADNGFLGEDPCPATPKYLAVQYQCVVKLGQPAQTSPAATTQSTLPTTTSGTTPATRTSSTTPTTPLANLPTGVLPIGVGSNNTPVRRNHTNTGAAQCNEYLVSGPRGIPDGQLSASSQLSLSNNAHRARLYTGIYKYSNGYFLEGGWTADPADLQPWIEVKMNWLTLVQGITTQGRHVNPDTGCCSEWVTRYVVRYSLDGQGWETVKDNNGQQKIFVGNTDTDTPITHMFDCPFVARFVRVEVLNYTGSASMRLDLIGCPTNSDDLGKCPKGWKERPGTDICYYISDQTDRKTWEHGMQTCKRQHAETVKIESLQEKIWLVNELQTLQKSQKLQSWWIGLNNRPRFDNNYYKWHDGSSLDRSVLQWHPSEPNNSGGIEHCASYDVTNGDLNDFDCDMSLPYICERAKYWLTPLNKPGLVTLKPPVQTTLVPSTMANKVPIPIGGGGNVVTSGNTVFFTGCFKGTDCAGRAWGDYPSCTACGYYLTCAPSGAYDRQCPLNLKYDANSKSCVQRSSTCTGP